MNRLFFALFLLLTGSSCTSFPGYDSMRSQGNGRFVCGPPSYECSDDGNDPAPLCRNCNFPQVPDMSTEPNAVSYDKRFGLAPEGNQIVRCTYPDTNANNSLSYNIGFGGSGDTNPIGKGGGVPVSYRLVLGDAKGWFYPFTYTPDPTHPRCVPTYPMNSFRVAEGSFSWLTPHLYYAFGGRRFVINEIDLGSIRLPERNTIADFQQILPRDGADWLGASRNVPLGTIIRPRSNNAGNYLYQATCAPGVSSCFPGLSGAALPLFSQIVMADTLDGSVVWRNIGVGFNDVASWIAVGGVSTDDDVFAKSFSDDGGQGGPGAIFVAVYKRSSNTYFLYNVGTGIISYQACEDGYGYTCWGGSWVQRVLGVADVTDRYVLHNLRISKSGQWVLIERGYCELDSCADPKAMYVWQLSTSEPHVSKVTRTAWDDWTSGFRFLVNQDRETGINLTARAYEALGESFPLNYSVNKKSNPSEAEIHPSWNYNDGSDTTPVCTATSALDWPYVAPWQNEVVCFGTNPNPDCSTLGHAPCRTTVKRLFHTYNSGTCDEENNFNSCYAIGALSQDGKYYAFTSNWGDTLGSIRNGGHGPGSCNGAFNFQLNHKYKVGDIFEPAERTGNNHPNQNFNAYQVTLGGRSSSYPPYRWPQAWSKKLGNYQDGDVILPLNSPNNPCNHYFKVTAGGGSATAPFPPIWKDLYGYSNSCAYVRTRETITDGGITWTDMGEFVLGTMHLANLGRDDCRSDVFIGVLN